MDFAVSNALITELGELKRRKYLLSWEKAAAATCFLILAVGFGGSPVPLRYLFFKI